MRLFQNRFLKIGILITTALVLSIWGVNYLKGKNILKPAYYYHAKYANVAGLSPSASVVVNGFKIGLVDEIRINPINTAEVIVSFILDEELDIPVDSKATLVSADILGTKVIRLDLGLSKTYYANDDTIASTVELGAMEKLASDFAPLKEKVETLINNANEILLSTRTAFDSVSVAALKESIKNLEATTESARKMMANNNQKIDKILSDLQATSGAIAAQKAEISGIIKNLHAISDTISQANLSKIFTNLDSAIQHINIITYQIANNKGSMGKLVNDTTLYHNLAVATNSANQLLTDLKEHPKRYLSFSLFDKSKSVYVDEKGLTSRLGSEKNITFSVLVKRTSTPLAINKDNFATPERINEIKSKDGYYYTIGNYNSLSVCKEECIALKSIYRDAAILILEKQKPKELYEVL